MREFSATHKTIIICAFLAALVVLTLTGGNLAALIAVGTAVLGGIGVSLGQVQAVKEQTNGHNAAMLDMIKQQGQMLATMVPVKVVDGTEPAQVYPIEIPTVSGAL